MINLDTMLNIDALIRHLEEKITAEVTAKLKPNFESEVAIRVEADTRLAEWEAELDKRQHKLNKLEAKVTGRPVKKAKKPEAPDFSNMRERLGNFASAQKIVDHVTSHKIRVPVNDRDNMKNSGAKFNKTSGWYFRSYVPDMHPLSKYRTGGGRWIKVTGLTFADIQRFKPMGLISETDENGKWHNYVIADDEHPILLALQNSIQKLTFEIEQ